MSLPLSYPEDEAGDGSPEGSPRLIRRTDMIWQNIINHILALFSLGVLGFTMPALVVSIGQLWRRESGIKGQKGKKPPVPGDRTPGSLPS